MRTENEPMGGKGTFVKTMNVPIENIVHRVAPLRTLYSPEEDLRQITILESDADIPLPFLRKSIEELDRIAPDRLHNGTTMGWRGMDGTPQSPYAMFSDIIHILSWYVPDIAKSFLIPFGNTMSQRMMKSKMMKFRFHSKSQMGQMESRLWREIGLNLGSHFKNFNYNLSLADEMFSINEISCFYMDKVGASAGGYTYDGEDEPAKENLRMEHASMVLASLDVMGDSPIRNLDKGAGMVFTPFSQELIQRIGELKLCFTEMQTADRTDH